MRQDGFGSRIVGQLGRILPIAALLAVVALPATAGAQVLASLPDAKGVVGSLEATGNAKPVLAWNSFCQRNAGECEVSASDPATVALTGRIWKALNAVNRQVNATVKPMTDQDHWGVVDRWDLPTDGFGDCEDFQLLKRKLLVERYGLSRRALRMTVVIDEEGEGHAVLMVRTDQGDLILDNKRSGILRWNDTGYVYVKREGDESLAWVSLGDRTSSPTTTANR